METELSKDDKDSFALSVASLNFVIPSPISANVILFARSLISLSDNFMLPKASFPTFATSSWMYDASCSAVTELSFIASFKSSFANLTLSIDNPVASNTF